MHSFVVYFIEHTDLLHSPGQVPGANPLLAAVYIADIQVVVTSRAVLVVEKVHGHCLQLADLFAVAH